MLGHLPDRFNLELFGAQPYPDSSLIYLKGIGISKTELSRAPSIPTAASRLRIAFFKKAGDYKGQTNLAQTQGIQAEEFAMLKTLLSSAKNLLCPTHNPGYQTKVYLTVGKPIMLHDSLDFGSLATAKEIELLTKFWQIEETPDANLSALDWQEPAHSFGSLSDIDYASSSHA